MLPEFPVKIVFTDIDGVWTDNGMYYSAEGFALKKFNTLDSAGVAFLEILQVPVVILTGEDTGETRRRAEKLGMKQVYCGIRNKKKLAEQVCAEAGIAIEQAAFIGNDLNDLPLLQAAGYSAAPADAPEYIRAKAGMVLQKKGGEGVFREFVETLLYRAGLLEYVVERFVENLSAENQNDR